MKMQGMHKRIAGPRLDTRDMLLAAGIGEYVATMSLPYMFFLPRTSDPYAQGVIQIVQGLQTLLNRHGADLEVDGGLGKKTIAALAKFSGPRWHDKSWAQLYGDVLRGRRWGGIIRQERGGPKPGAMGYDYVSPPNPLGSSLVGDVLMSPIAWAGAAALAWWKWFR